MAINVKDIIADAFLSLCQKENLSHITIKQILIESNVSRQTFYNHFLDKNDLIHYIYNTRIIPDFNIGDGVASFRDSLILSFDNMKKYFYFMKPACMINDQNCLKDYIFQHCKSFDLSWHQALYGDKPMPDTLRFATEYHAIASSSMTLSWILSDMPVSSMEIANMIVEMRSIGMEELFKGGEFEGNPYKIGDKHE